MPFALLHTFQVPEMCTPGQRVSLTGPGPSFFKYIYAVSALRGGERCVWCGDGVLEGNKMEGNESKRKIPVQ